MFPCDTLENCHLTLLKDVGQCRPIHGLCVVLKSELVDVKPLLQCTEERRRIFAPPTIWGMSIVFVLTSIQVFCESQQEELCVGLAYRPNTWPVKIGTDLSRQEARFELWQRVALSHGRRFLAIATLPIPWLHFCVLPKPNAHPISKFSRSMYGYDRGEPAVSYR